VQPLVLLHAGVADSRMWAPILSRLERSRRVLAPDGLGYGERPLPKAPFSRVDDVRELLDREGIVSAAVVGASDGGRVAIDLALDHPDRVGALVLAAPALGGWSWSQTVRDFGAREDALLQAGKLDEAVDLNVRTWVDGRGRDPEAVDPAVRELVRKMQERALEHLLSAYASEPHPQEHGPDTPAAERLRHLAVPTLVVVGELDLPDFPAIADRIAVEAPRARVISLTGVAHLPSLEKPELFAELVLAFLEELDV
jgi:pimeloyl-ACP methyl ester carboxylesterase